MNLIIDVGNTFTKLAVFSKDDLLHKISCPTEEVASNLNTIFSEYTIKRGIISSVGNFNTKSIEKYTAQVSFIWLDANTPAPFTNAYSTPKTLGVDRIALASAAAVKFPKKNTLIIDAGSCITIDFLSAQNIYHGGTITPGIRMRYKALHTFTANLPLLETQVPSHIIGNSTANAMHIGATQGVVYEIEGTITAYKKQFSDLTIILTGGDTQLLRDHIKSDIFANSNFLLEGLHFILEHNTN